MVEHTPTPWSLFDGHNTVFVKGNETFIFDDRNTDQHVAMMSKNYGESTSTTREGREEANAKFIVTACNNHDALVEVLSELYEAISIGPLMAAATQGPDFDIDANLRDKGFAAACLLADLQTK